MEKTFCTMMHGWLDSPAEEKDQTMSTRCMEMAAACPCMNTKDASDEDWKKMIVKMRTLCAGSKE